MLRRRDITLIHVEQEFENDAQDCTFIVRGVRAERRQAVLDALKDVRGFTEMGVMKRWDEEPYTYSGARVGDIAIGVTWYKQEESDWQDEGRSRIHAALTRLFPRTRIRKRKLHPYRGDSVAEGIWGGGWEDSVALTEEERAILA